MTNTKKIELILEKEVPEKHSLHREYISLISIEAVHQW